MSSSKCDWLVADHTVEVVGPSGEVVVQQQLCMGFLLGWVGLGTHVQHPHAVVLRA